MSTKEISAKELHEADPKRFEEEHWKWTEHMPDYEWYDYLLNDFKEQGKAKGFDIEDIRFTGFWSQGDGASWTGDVDIVKYIEANNLQADPQWFGLGELVKGEWVARYVGVYTRDPRNSHYNTMRSEWYRDTQYDESSVFDAGPLMGALVSKVADSVDWELCEEHMLEDAKSFADDMYKALREEYEYLTSEESFIEHCECNEVMFEVEVDEEEEVQ